MRHDTQPENYPRSRTRRDLLIGSSAAIATLAVGSTQPARAANGDLLKLGNSDTVTNTASLTTELDTTAAIGLLVTASAGAGVQGQSDSGRGVVGTSNLGDGVHGEGGTGVRGVGSGGTGGFFTSTGDDGVYGQGAARGVHGFVSTATGTGVYGQGHIGVNGFGDGGTGGYFTSTGDDGVYGQGATRGLHGFVSSNGGTAVFGFASDGIGVQGTGASSGVDGVGTSSAAIGVRATNTHGGDALRVEGTSRFSRAGVAKVAGTDAHPRQGVVVPVPGAPLNAHSLVLATVQQTAGGAAVRSAVPGGATFTINLDRKVTTTVKVAWFIVES